MDRPVLNPMADEEPGALAAPARRWRAAVVHALGRVAAILLWRPGRRPPPDGTPTGRFWRGLLYRAAFAPLLAALAAAVLVFAATHRPVPVCTEDPASRGVYYDPVSFVGEDGARLEAWLIPAIDARQIIEQGESALHRRDPAIILLHDQGQDRTQLLSLVRPLHDAGYTVLAVALRGAGTNSSRGQTFGLREAGDVCAAVELLSRRPFVDRRRIAAVGVGSGATAALLASREGAELAALVLEDPLWRFSDVLRQRIGPRSAWLRWLHPLCAWSFEIGYGVDADQMREASLTGVMKQQPTLLLDQTPGDFQLGRPTAVRQVRAFMDRHLKP